MLVSYLKVPTILDTTYLPTYLSQHLRVELDEPTTTTTRGR